MRRSFRRNRIPVPHGKRAKAASRCRHSGEWTRAGYRAPACYVTNAWSIIRATFSAAPADLSSVTLLADTDAAIGGFAATNVAFAGGAASDVALSTKSATTNCILKETFDLTWKAVVSNETEIVTNILGKTDGHVFYTILGEPKLPWTDSIVTNQNVWVSVLDFLSESNRCLGATTTDVALKRLTEYLFADHGLIYDTFSGGSAYIKFRSWDDASFRIDSYMTKNRGIVVNCYDQACSLAVLGRSLGLDAILVYMEPFGYIQETSLVGGLRSNNPFFSNPRHDFHAVCPTNSPKRSGFRKHMFVTQGGMAFDACSGPVTGQWTRVEYIEHVIDTNRVSTCYPTGTDADANPYLGIREVIE